MNNNSVNVENAILSNSSKIETNKNSIEDNDTDIAYNLREINYIKNNISEPYLKNIYNILFYDSKTQVDFKNSFYEKVFVVDSKQNDFIEMNFKINLEYEDISDRNYIKIIYEIFDENGYRLYTKSINNNNKYLCFSNKVIIDENIFYNFNKDIKKIKFIIKFQMLLPNVIKI